MASPLVPLAQLARRKSIILHAEIGRVITRPYLPSSEQRSRKVIQRVLQLTEDEVSTLLENLLHDFSHRHRNFRQSLEGNFNQVSHLISNITAVSEQQKLLIGAYFTAEYSVEAAALFNPSIVQVANQNNDPDGACRFVMSFRATGEGHISSIEFRSGVIDSNNDIFFDAQSNYVETPEIHANPDYDRHLFRLKIQEMGASNSVTHQLLNKLPDTFTFNDLQNKITELQNNNNFPSTEKTEAIDMAMWLARSNYQLLFRKDFPISERVIFPVSESESNGIEDARFVRFVDDDGTVKYYATYTAYNGETILPQLIETDDFLAFKMITLNGVQVQGKGMALFPRKIHGQYVMLSRQDGENNAIMFSDNLHFWQHAQILQEPEFAYEFIQMGNGGSPVEIPEGWLLVTHGVGPMRTYSLSIELLDLDDPTRIISRIEEPILMPDAHEREGYVPNVVYSCGALIHQNELFIPYASGDQRCGFVTLQLPQLMARLQHNAANRRANNQNADNPYYSA